ncbi:MAG: LysM peptidoglycan-binding domain-containing protein [Candidatus Omnitrophota bacterium]
MPKKLLKGTLILVCFSGFLGCSVANDISVRSYKQDKKRVDQIVEGTVGNWENAPQATSKQVKETRKVYFLEFIKEPPAEPSLDFFINDEKNDKPEKEIPQSSTNKPVKNNFSGTAKNHGNSSNTKGKIEIPSFDEPYVENSAAKTTNQRFVDYTVDKNDTLQKISMKFYNSYSKWPRIYEANKDVLKSPDVLKPGVNLKIPVE